jgi:DNA-binding HxlR family transcriptional regulator
MTTKKHDSNAVSDCPAEETLKLLSGKWKPQIFQLAVQGPLRFSGLLRQIKGSNKQSIAVALKELEALGLLDKTIIRLKPLHIEYVLSEKGKTMLPVFQLLENLKQQE